MDGGLVVGHGVVILVRERLLHVDEPDDAAPTGADRLVGDDGDCAAGDRERWAFTLTQYNGGGTVTGAERKARADSRGCDPKRYFDNVERFCGAAGRSAASCKENREYPKIILDHWRPMYQGWLSG